jgi:GTP-binding protein
MPQDNQKQLLRSRLPVVAIVGRPNVGKSTLFNRITGHQKAVVHDTPGLTRDRNYLAAEWEGRHFLLVDTGGYEMDTAQPLLKQMREQTMIAIEEADSIIFLVSLDEPSNPTDDEIMNMLRRTQKPVLLTVNKCDNRTRRDLAVTEFSRFGCEKVYGVSALHGNATDELLDALVAALPSSDDEDAISDGIRIAVVGRQNVGKSTLVNQILGFERTIASSIAGTTRDAIDTTFRRDDTIYTLIDTAGIRRRGKVQTGVEKLTVLASMMSLEKCDIALVIVDASEGLTEQDAHIAGYAVDAGCGCVLVVNKWDSIEKDTNTAGEFVKTLREELGFIRHVPVITISAKTGQRVDKLFQIIKTVDEQYRREIETGRLNDFLRQATTRLSPPVRSGRQLKLKYVTQTGSRPPTFTFFVNDPKLVHFSYQRYLMNQLRAEFGFEGVPVRMRFRQKAETPTWLGKTGNSGKRKS